VTDDLRNVLTRMQAGLRYDDAVNWFDPADLEFLEAIPRGTKPTVFAFRYTPTGRHLFLDERGRTYQFVRASNPSKAEGTFRLQYQHAAGIDALRPELQPRATPFDAWDDDDDQYGGPEPPGFVCSTACYGSGMRREITQRELRNQSGEIMRALDEGDEFVVTRNGIPVGELLPLRRRNFVPTDALLEEFRGAPPVDLEKLRADLDAVASQDPWPRG
jgi:antitoxin (DNA-binding transcriptional repressor) of toxin-antitoxin stability system